MFIWVWSARHIPLSAVAPSVAQTAALRLHAPLNAGTVAHRPSYEGLNVRLFREQYPSNKKMY
ncbi:hypothetical protein C1I36_10795 [Dehalobacter sp. 14DCB1]|nr:hypothetical protein C1I36_10795 [Dehalobacter sp. 14DCB1]